MPALGDLPRSTLRRPRRSLFRAPPTRREALLFGALILALAWTVETGTRERRVVHIVPNFETPTITSTSAAPADFQI